MINHVLSLARNQTEISHKTFSDWVRCNQIDPAVYNYTEQELMSLVESLVTYAKRYN
jgi:hypothetical protein